MVKGIEEQTTIVKYNIGISGIALIGPVNYHYVQFVCLFVFYSGCGCVPLQKNNNNKKKKMLLLQYVYILCWL